MTQHAPRIDFETVRKTAPDWYAAMTALSNSVKDSGLDPALVEMVKVRVSQINGCKFCEQFHKNVAFTLKIEQEKLDNLASWKSSNLYSPQAKAGLAWAETLTLMANTPISDESFLDVREHFTESEVIFLSFAIGTINNWNRIAEGLLFTPPAPLKH